MSRKLCCSAGAALCCDISILRQWIHLDKPLGVEKNDNPVARRRDTVVEGVVEQSGMHRLRRHSVRDEGGVNILPSKSLPTVDNITVTNGLENAIWSIAHTQDYELPEIL